MFWWQGKVTYASREIREKLHCGDMESKEIGCLLGINEVGLNDFKLF